jgi:hypothetical protein
MKTTSSKSKHNKDPTPTNLSSNRDPKAELVTNNPTRVTSIIKNFERKSLPP